jgi:5-methylcytosine-specific restriction protein A
MPTSPLQLCVEPGCGNLVTYGRCAEHLTEYRRTADRRRPNGYQRGYTTKWATFSKDYLTRHPVCECDTCTAAPPWRRQAATDVDHTSGHSRTCPHAYDERHLQALSHSHHAEKTSRDDGSYGRTPRQQRCTG